MNPTIAVVSTAAMNRYVGMANSRPDSLTPRRFSSMSTTTIDSANAASCPRSAGIATAAYCAPEETDTATVST